MFTAGYAGKRGWKSRNKYVVIKVNENGSIQTIRGLV